jgi:broad specificity phosphatase PhoE
VEFPPTMTEQDEAWTPHRRETLSDVNRRIDHFFDWLLLVSMLPSSSLSSNNGVVVVVISHGVWIECLLRRFVGALPDGRRVHNADAYAIRLELLDDGPSSVVDHDHDHRPHWVHRVAASHVEQIHDGSSGVVPSGTTTAHPSAPAAYR